MNSGVRQTASSDTVSDSAIRLVSRMLDENTFITSRVERVTRQLERAITVGVLTVGDRLPSEAELAKQLGVSTITLRQSLAALRANGYLVTRSGRGGGSFISSDPSSAQAHLLRELTTRSSEELQDIGDFAAAIGEGTARRAAERADDHDLKQIRRASYAFERADSAESRRRSDGRFHLSIGAAAHSQRLANCTLQLHGELAPLTWLSVDVDGRIALAVQEHQAIVDAIADADAAAAGELARKHYEREVLDVIRTFMHVTAERGNHEIS